MLATGTGLCKAQNTSHTRSQSAFPRIQGKVSESETQSTFLCKASARFPRQWESADVISSSCRPFSLNLLGLNLLVSSQSGPSRKLTFLPHFGQIIVKVCRHPSLSTLWMWLFSPIAVYPASGCQICSSSICNTQ